MGIAYWYGCCVSACLLAMRSGTCAEMCGRANAPCNCASYRARAANADSQWCVRKEVVVVDAGSQGDVQVEETRCVCVRGRGRGAGVCGGGGRGAF